MHEGGGERQINQPDCNALEFSLYVVRIYVHDLIFPRHDVRMFEQNIYIYTAIPPP